MLKRAGLAMMSALIFAVVCRAQGSIAGSVTTVAGDPVRGATLRLSMERQGQEPVVYSVFSDAKGNFVFADLAAGSYSLCLDKSGYLFKCYADSARRELFDLAPGQKLTIAIKMMPQAVISGRITDENGEAVPNLRVEAARWSYRKGQQRLQAIGGRRAGISNAEGAFSIGDLEAGFYYLRVDPQPTLRSGPAIPKGPAEALLATYYPGVTDPSKAISVQVAAGGAVRGIDIRVHKTRAYRIRGKLAGLAAGAPPPNLSVQLTTIDSSLSSVAVRDGTFDFEGVVPGDYILEVRSPSGFARQKVAIGGADLDDVVLQLAPPLEITETISVEGRPGMAGHPTVQLTSAEGQGATSPPARDNGTFAISNIMPAAMYHVEVQALPPGTYVKTVHCGDQDVTKAPFDLTSGRSGTLTIVLSPNAGEIVAVVHDPDGLPHPGMNLSLWTPGIPAEGVPDFTRMDYTDHQGQFKFTIGGLEAGSYFLQVPPRTVSVSPPAIQKGQEEAFVTTYYPGVTDVSSAIAVPVAAGAVVRGIEIRMRKARAYRIRGKVIGAAGGAPLSVQLTANGGQPGLRPTRLQDGVFDYDDVLPGLYVVQATSGRPPASTAARQIVTVGNADVDDLVLQLGPGAEIAGTISIEGDAPRQPPQQRPIVALIPTVGTGGASSNNPQAPDDGTFAIHNVMPAIYRVDVQRLPPGTYIKSIGFGGQDVMKAPLDLTSGSGGTLSVVLSPNAGDITGIVRGADAGALVTLWTPGVPVEGTTAFTRTASTDANGQFKFASLPPGEYRIAAWEIINQLYGLELAPEFWNRFDSQAAMVKLDENAHQNTEAPLIGRDAIEAEAAKLQ